MKHFLDTSVLIAAFLESNAKHRECKALLGKMRPEVAACSSHTLAELYSVITRLPHPLRLRPEEGILVTGEVCERLSTVALSEKEYLHTLKTAAEAGVGGGRVYDALLLACARKCGAEKIHTLNLRHFQALAPDLAERIVMP
ncbi:PIN domain-containing protein [Paracidobacterium acidisoli]|uniref:Ribonuclease VapC n=1 Tax=Paracidobacterium acidisoli TaxID=2303751 RepID=A0A372IPC9_9BACT|nr:PIN domain-containing protein [Paracidobacterium acidisoli]